MVKRGCSDPFGRAGHWVGLDQADGVRLLDLADLAASAGRDLALIPFSIRVLIENVARGLATRATGLVTRADLDALLAWDQNWNRGIPLHMPRVILPDSSGVPVLQDLAALRDAVARAGGDPASVDARIPLDLVVDHSLQVDRAGSPDAMSFNRRREVERNAERYRFLKWAQQAFRGLRIFPPGTGIIHQINLEHIATVVMRESAGGETILHPDFVIGCDSHTPMVNGIGVLGWGVGGIDATAAILGQPYVFPIPEVVGVRLDGTLPTGVTTTDLALTVTERLRRENVTGSFVEYVGPGADALSIPERATLANMSPEYGATCGFFPIDAATIAYLRRTGRPGCDPDEVERYARRAGLFRTPDMPVPAYSRLVAIDLRTIEPSLAGPRRPQDRLSLGDVASDFLRRLPAPLSEDGFAAEPAYAEVGLGLDHGSVVIAALTSCTNTSNPAVMLAAGLVARKAVALGLTVPTHVKTSLAPGSRVVTRYLEEAGLLAPLEQLGFHVVGYGCTTCGGKSGPLAAEVVQEIESRGLVAAAVLSGNRNFEGRIHQQVRANYIGSPPLVVAYALAGRVTIDLAREPVAHRSSGEPVMLADLWPSADEIERLIEPAMRTELFRDTYATSAADGPWEALEAPTGDRFAWDLASTYLVEPPFFSPDRMNASHPAVAIVGARVLGAFGDSVTTDHISPGGEIPPESPAGRYLTEQGVARADYNTYVGRRGNPEVMTRATFANLRIKNLLVPGKEGWFTRLWPEGGEATIYEAAEAYRQARIPMIVLAGREYGTGSSRDWAAKGTALLGISAVIAQSYERIHRANLVGMGVLPLLFAEGEGWRELGLTGAETFDLAGVETGIWDAQPIEVIARGAEGEIRFRVTADLLTESERHLLVDGGILPTVLRAALRESAASLASSQKPASRIR